MKMQLRTKNKLKLSEVEDEIRKMQVKAKEAKLKGMHATYSNYMLDISILKGQLQKLRTHPHRQL
jgi:hypothetical protein